MCHESRCVVVTIQVILLMCSLQACQEVDPDGFQPVKSEEAGGPTGGPLPPHLQLKSETASKSY